MTAGPWNLDQNFELIRYLVRFKVVVTVDMPWNHSFKYSQFWLIFRTQVLKYIKSDVLIKSCFDTAKCDRSELGECSIP